MRNRFQFHLGTALILVVVASLLLWQNYTEKMGAWSEYKRGWPFTYRYYGGDWVTIDEWYWLGLAGNVVVVLVTLLTCGVALEKLFYPQKKEVTANQKNTD